MMDSCFVTTPKRSSCQPSLASWLRHERRGSFGNDFCLRPALSSRAGAIHVTVVRLYLGAGLSSRPPSQKRKPPRSGTVYVPRLPIVLCGACAREYYDSRMFPAPAHWAAVFVTPPTQNGHYTFSGPQPCPLTPCCRGCRFCDTSHAKSPLHLFGSTRVSAYTLPNRPGVIHDFLWTSHAKASFCIVFLQRCRHPFL